MPFEKRETLHRVHAVEATILDFFIDVENMIEVDSVWMKEAKLDLQKAFMCAIRAVTQGAEYADGS